MTKKDIAIIGGTFDPVHNGHIAMAKYLADNYIVDEVWMLPSYNSPHKDIDTKKSFENRVNMLNLSFQNDNNVKISLFEREYYESKDKEIKTYTIDILDAIKNKYLNLRIHFIVGFDSIKQISTWHNYKKLLNDFWFYIFDREDNEFTTKEQKEIYLKNLRVKNNINFYYEFMNIDIPNISSTEIRLLLKDRLKNKGKLLTLIPEKVYNYICENNLYFEG